MLKILFSPLESFRLHYIYSDFDKCYYDPHYIEMAQTGIISFYYTHIYAMLPIIFKDSLPRIRSYYFRLDAGRVYFTYILNEMTNYWFALFFIFGFVYIISYYTTNKTSYVFHNSFLVLFLFKIIFLVWSLFVSNFKFKTLNYLYHLLLVIFLFILLSNFLGLIPFSFTLTSHFITTFTLSASIFIGLNITGITIHGFHFLSLFIPKGVPVFLIPLLTLIEIVSYFARVFSLAIRLFANLMAGHALITILNGFVWLILLYSPLGLLNSMFLFLIVYAVGNLEFIIAALQAYVFIMLVSLYYQEIIELH